MKNTQTSAGWKRNAGVVARIIIAAGLLIGFQGGFLAAEESEGCDLWCKINQGVSYCQPDGDLCTYSRCFPHDPPTCYYVCAPSSTCEA